MKAVWLTWFRAGARWGILGMPLLLGCEGRAGGSPVIVDPPDLPDVRVVSTPYAAPLDHGDWSVVTLLENLGGSGEFRILILAGDDTTRLTEVNRITAGEQFGAAGGSGGFFSPGPRRPTLIAVESRKGAPQPWMETDRAAVLPD